MVWGGYSLRRLKRYLTPANWYSDNVEILLHRSPCEIEDIKLIAGHEVRIVTNENVADSQRFEGEKYIHIYKKMLEHGDTGVFGYIDGKCACRLWGLVKPNEQLYYGQDLHMEFNAIYVQYVETAKDCRRQGIFGECLSFLINMYKDRDMYVIIDMENTASMNGHKKLGFEEEAVVLVRNRCMRERSFVHWLKGDDHYFSV